MTILVEIAVCWIARHDRQPKFILCVRVLQQSLFTLCARVAAQKECPVVFVCGLRGEVQNTHDKYAHTYIHTHGKSYECVCTSMISTHAHTNTHMGSHSNVCQSNTRWSQASCIACQCTALQLEVGQEQCLIFLIICMDCRQ